jgi:hypothetical protein
LPDRFQDGIYTDAQTLLDSQRDQVRITGPVVEDPSWQARAGTGFDKSHFQVDWDRRVVTCPAGHQSISWGHLTKRKISYANKSKSWGRHASPTSTCMKSWGWYICLGEPAAFRGRRRESLSERRMREIRMSGAMRGMWKRGYGQANEAPLNESGG